MKHKTIKTFNQAKTFLTHFIPQGSRDKFPGNEGVKRTKLLLKNLGDPQEKPQIIHIAGTSGKGTTATITAELLKAHGKKVGLHLSPHLFDIRERMLINSKKITKEKFITHLNAIIPSIEKTNEERGTNLTYFEILTALAFFTFSKENVDVAVIETGMGGTHDATNSIKNKDKLAVITKIGLDHTQILGNTLEKIAAQKAGIIQKQNTVVALNQKERVINEIKKACKIKNSNLHVVRTEKARNSSTITAARSTFCYKDKDRHFKRLQLSLIGKHQVENACVAIKASELALKLLRTKLNESKVREVLKNLSIPGRFDVINIKNKTVIIDGAHNPQKTRALTQTFKSLYKDRKATVILAIKKGKNTNKILAQLEPITQNLITTAFHTHDQDLIQLSQNPKDVASQAHTFSINNVQATASPAQALEVFLKSKSDVCIITGSLYYLAQVYEHLEKIKKPKQPLSTHLVRVIK